MQLRPIFAFRLIASLTERHYWHGQMIFQIYADPIEIRGHLEGMQHRGRDTRAERERIYGPMRRMAVPFQGVATRYLKNYLGWCCAIDRLRILRHGFSERRLAFSLLNGESAVAGVRVGTG